MKKKKLIILIAALLLVVSLGVALAFIFLGNDGNSSNSDNPSGTTIDISEYDIPQSQLFNSSLSLPNFTMTIDGKTEDASSILISPSGLSYEEKTITLDETGTWTIRFTAVIDDKIYQEESSFLVYRKTYQFTEKEGSITIGTPSMYPDSAEGLIVDIPRGSKFVYNDVIDLRDLSNTEGFIKLAPLPSTKGTADYGKIYITLTDAYDPSIYVSYQVKDPNVEYPGNYVGLGCITASFSGEEKWCGNITYPQTAGYTSAFGTYVYMSFDGVPKVGANPKLTWLAYDEVDNIAHTPNKIYAGTVPHPYYKTMIADLGREYDLQYHEKKEVFDTKFNGFTTGEVYLSMWIDGLSGGSGKVFIENIAGADFTKQDSFDVNSPILTIETETDQNGLLPFAKVGVPFNIFSAKVMDNELYNIQYSTSVYYMDGATRLYSVAINDGSFTPDVSGFYQIVYKAVDGYGNITEQTCLIEARGAVRIPTGNMVGEYVTDCFYGKSFDVAEFEPVVYSGKPRVNVQIRNNGVVVEENVETFRPTKPGKYRVAYQITDYIGQTYEIGYDVNVTYSIDPLLDIVPTIPSGFIVGQTHSFKAPQAYDYYTRQGECDIIDAKITVDEGNGAVTLSSNSYTPSAGVDSVDVKFIYQTVNGKTVIAYDDVPVVEVKSLSTDFVKYFVTSDGVTIEQISDSMVAWFNSNATMSFIKEIPIEETFTFNIYQDTYKVYNNASKINYKFIDTAIPDNVLLLSFIKDGDAIKMSINDGISYSVQGSFSDPKEQISFLFNCVNDLIEINGQKIKIKSFLSGNDFTGFTQNKAYLEISVEGVEQGKTAFGLKMLSIAGQSLVAIRDLQSPILFVEENQKLFHEINSTTKTAIAYATDVLSSTKTLYTVFDPEGEVVTSVDGILLQNIPSDVVYEFMFTKYGNYRTVYTAKDGNNRESIREVFYQVIDTIAPELSVKKLSISCKVDELVELPTATFSDNLSSIDNLSVAMYYLDPEFRIYQVEDVYVFDGTISATFTFNIAGEWKISYYVVDEASNIAKVDVTVIVEG